jgi:8-oxo-dGTP pyrophosphatase MutT (NUDIX family)
MLLQELLCNYQPVDAEEAAMTAQLRQFLQDASLGTDAFGRELAGSAPLSGHVTGSAWIINGQRTRTVLVHHAKLGRWVQPGGHCDGDSDLVQVALREAREETGLDVTPLKNDIFDIDVHAIPEYWNTPEHLHFDVRFLLQADDAVQPVVSSESRAVRWVSLEEAEQLNSSSSVTRMVTKTRRLRP